MARIRVYLDDDQEEWVRQVSRRLDESDAEVIRRVIDVQREKRDDILDGTSGESGGSDGSPSGETAGAGAAGAASDGGATREQLLERIEKLERELANDADAESESDDGGMGWR